MKKIPYGRQTIDAGDIKEIVRVLKSDWVTQGPRIKDFEDALCGYTGVKYAVAASSGTAALHIAALSAGIGKRDEVITSPVTFLASSNCVLYCGGKPVFADIQKDTVNIDPAEVKRRINAKTKAVIPVHFAGHPADMKEIRGIAKKHRLTVIEDAAHALGAEYRGSKVGSCKYSDMTVFSFHPVKTITTGEGGAVLTNRRDLYERLLMYRNHGITKDGLRSVGPWYYEQQFLGFNYRITDIQCALGLSQLRKLDSFLKRRKEIINIYSERLRGVDSIILPGEREYVRSAWHIYYIRLKDASRRRAVFERLQKLGIGTQVHYIPVHLQPYYRETLGYGRGDYPKAEDYYKRAMTIPLYPAMREKDIRFVIKTLKEVLL